MVDGLADSVLRGERSNILVVDTSNFEAVGKPDPSAMDAMVTFSHDNPGSDWLELEVPLATNQGAKILRIYVRRR